MILCKMGKHDAMAYIGPRGLWLPVPDVTKMTDEEILDVDYGSVQKMRIEWRKSSKLWLSAKLTPGKTLFNRCKGRTAIIVGGGPMLNRNIRKIDELVKTGKYDTFGINQACSVYPCRYNIAIDPACQPTFYINNTNVERFLIAVPISNPSLSAVFPQENVRLFNTNSSVLYNSEARSHDLGSLFSHSNSIHATMHLIYRMGYDKTVFIATNFIKIPGKPHYCTGRDDHKLGPKDLKVNIDSSNPSKYVITNNSLMRHSANISMLYYWLKKAGMIFEKPYGILGYYMNMIDALFG